MAATLNASRSSAPNGAVGWSGALLHAFRRRPAAVFAVVVAVLLVSRWLLLPVAEGLVRDPGRWTALAGQFIYTVLNVAAIAVVALPLQALFPAMERRPKVLSYEYWLDLIYWHQGLLMAALSVSAALLSISTWIESKAGGPWFPSLSAWPAWQQVLLSIWLYDLVVYWRHRSEHALGVLWSFHAIHHSAQQVDVLTTLRLHPLEIAYAVLTNTVVLMVGLSAEAVALGYSVYTGWNYFIHCNVRIRFNGFMKFIFVTPFMHQWHHALDEEAAGKNVGVVFAWNDWLFGTAHHPDQWPACFGLDASDSSRLPQSYWRQLVYPIQCAWAAWRKP